MPDDRRRSGLPEAAKEVFDASRGHKLPGPRDPLPDASGGSELLERKHPASDASRGSEPPEGGGGGPSAASRPSELAQRSTALQARAAEFHQRLYDPQAKRFM